MGVEGDVVDDGDDQSGVGVHGAPFAEGEVGGDRGQCRCGRADPPTHGPTETTDDGNDLNEGGARIREVHRPKWGQSADMKSGTRFRVPLFVGLLQCGRCDQRPLPTVDVAEPTTACC